MDFLFFFAPLDRNGRYRLRSWLVDGWMDGLNRAVPFFFGWLAGLLACDGRRCAPHACGAALGHVCRWVKDALFPGARIVSSSTCFPSFFL